MTKKEFTGKLDTDSVMSTALEAWAIANMTREELEAEVRKSRAALSRQPEAQSAPGAVPYEEAAKAIYMLLKPDGQGSPQSHPWQHGGNSDMQCYARQLAHAAMTAYPEDAPIAAQEPDWWAIVNAVEHRILESCDTKEEAERLLGFSKQYAKTPSDVSVRPIYTTPTTQQAGSELPPYDDNAEWTRKMAREVQAVPAPDARDGVPDDLRADGWAVAVHNDYRLNGEPHTFWLFTKDGRAVKGEGRTDADALTQVRAALKSQATPDTSNTFRDHLKKCSEEVATWPAWKKKSLTPASCQNTNATQPSAAPASTLGQQVAKPADGWEAK